MTNLKQHTANDDSLRIENSVYNDLSRAESKVSEPVQVEDVFTRDEGDVNFRGVSWQAAAILVTKFQIGLGALSLPHTFHVLGFFPGILCLVIIAIISTTAGYICGNARQYYPHMHNISDAAELLFGKAGKEIVGASYYAYLSMTAGAGMLTTSVAFNALSDHAACTMVFVAIAAVASLIVGTGFRTLEKVAWISWAGVASIFVAIWITTIACLSQDRPAAGPRTGSINLEIRVFPDTTFPDAMSAVSNQLFSMGAPGTFFSVSAEMRHPEMFTRSLMCGQAFLVATYIISSSIVYGKVGRYLASPALGSAGALIKKVSYGIALPGLLVTAVLFSHIAAKYVFVRVLKGTPHLQSNTFRHWTVWIGAMLTTIIFGFVIVGAVPFFSDFLSLVGALINPIFTNVVPGFMLLFCIARRPVKVAEGRRLEAEREADTGRHWLADSFLAYKRGWKATLLFVGGCFMIVSGAFIIVGGTYATVLTIKKSYDSGVVAGVFSCADNSL